MASMDEQQGEVPIFLRKLYAMVNEVDNSICDWHADDGGKSFVIKQQKAFETSVIPQFFKHSKIASFVRQLNFYSFRKIPHTESLRIDPVLEKQTKDWWRFRHDSFQQGKPELLQFIKRNPNPGKTSTNSDARNPKTAVKAQTPRPTPSNDVSVNSEVFQLKKKIAEMSKNIDELTTLVHKVSLKQEEDETVGNKRRKPVSKHTNEESSEEKPDFAMSNAEIEEMVAMSVDSILGEPTVVLSAPEAIAIGPMDTTPALSDGSETCDFVDCLFDAFAAENNDLEFPDVSSSQGQARVSSATDCCHPDPELMRRLGDALMLLPKDIQELIVDRLIAAIMHTDIVASKTAVAAVEEEAHRLEETIPQTSDDEMEEEPSKRPENSLPLAAATLAALLHHYSTEVAAKSHQKHKCLPVIPVHA